MPKASAPNAPCVLVCESPQTIVMPGWVSPSCGPMTWTMPWLGEPMPWSGMPNSAQFVSSCVIWAAAIASMIGRLRGVVGIEWSAVATVWPGRRTPMPRARRPEKACGLVTSCTRWRSMARTAGAPGSWLTTWSVQILSTIVRGVLMPRSVPEAPPRPGPGHRDGLAKPSPAGSGGAATHPLVLVA